MQWPALREELQLLPGPVLPDGQPSWTLHDPVRNLFFRIDWPAFEVLQRWGSGPAPDIAADINQHTTLNLTPEDVVHVSTFLIHHQLTRPEGEEHIQRMTQTWQRQQGTWLSWLIHHYLFFRIPLWRPDAWLTRWQHVALWFCAPQFVTASILALLLGLWQVIRQWDGFMHALVDTFNWSGLLAYGTAIAAVKVLHELGHAFSAKTQGCRVPTMGVAFLVMWPVAYTDTNESWRLTDRWGRLKIASAGIMTELMIGVWALLAWGWLPDGALRSACFVLATSSLVATLGVNASPFMRFDGYFILSDLLDLPNLHERSFALARWQLREWLFDLGDPPPEHFTKGKQRALIAFAWMTWLYRLVLFLGIAALVYHFFIKLVGIMLFAIEMIWFIAKPIVTEMQAWHQRMETIVQRQRSRISLGILFALCLLVMLPWPTRVTGSAMLRPTETWPLFAPTGALIESLPYQNGDHVTAGSPMIRLRAPDLEMRRQAAQARLDRLGWLASSSVFDTQTKDKLRVNEEQVQTARAELAGLDTEAAQQAPSAPYAGHIRDMDPDLQAGQWVTRKERLAVLVHDNSPWQIETWLDESDVQRLALGDQARFALAQSPMTSLPAHVLSIEKDASHVLPRAELAVQHGGHLLVREKDGHLYPEQAVYRVVLAVEPGAIQDAELIRHSWRGIVTIHAAWQAPAWPYLRQAMAVLVREFSF